MVWQTGQSGNPGGKPAEKPWRDAIRKALKDRELGEKPGALRDLANKLLDKAMQGDMVALKEIGDRTDGKVPQGLIHTGDEEGGPVQAKVTIEYVTATAGLPVPESTEGG